MLHDAMRALHEATQRQTQTQTQDADADATEPVKSHGAMTCQVSET